MVQRYPLIKIVLNKTGKPIVNLWGLVEVVVLVVEVVVVGFQASIINRSFITPTTITTSTTFST